MNKWREELHVVNMKEAPIFSMEDNFPVLAEYVLSEYFLGVVRGSTELPKPILVFHITLYCVATKKLFSL